MACERNFIKPKTKGTEPRPREQILCQNFSVLEYMRTVALKLPSPSPPPDTHTRTRAHTLPTIDLEPPIASMDIAAV